MATREITLIYVSAKGKPHLRTLLRRIPSASRSSRADARALMVRLGQAALAEVKKAFIEKAGGGTDEAGDRWKPLSPYTIAYRRRHLLVGKKTGKQSKTARLPGSKKRAAYRPSFQLTDAQRIRWKKLFRKFFLIYDDKARAAQMAWNILKAEGAKTILSTYGSAAVEILRDTGLLYNSLSPGAVTPNASSAPRIPHQVFRIGKGEVIIGTNRLGAAGHHRGIPGRLPQRRLWPPMSRWPAAWWRRIGIAGREGVIEIIRHLVEGGVT